MKNKISCYQCKKILPTDMGFGWCQDTGIEVYVEHGCPKGLE